MKHLEFDPAAFEDLAWWIQQDRKKALRIVKLLKEVQRTPFVVLANSRENDGQWQSTR